MRTDLFPFRSRFCHLREGRMHYVDEGQGLPLLMVHGNPEWSFSFRKPIARLSSSFRCIAPDHLGFGLSDKGETIDLSPQAHAKRLKEFIERMDLDGYTLLMNDWGGPIGMSVAMNDPGRVRSLVVLNSWLWPLGNSPLLQLYSRFMGSSFGALLIRKKNILIRWGMPLGFSSPSRFDKTVREGYLKPFPNPRERKGQWVFAHHILASRDWFQNSWNCRNILKDKSLGVFKGDRDRIFGVRTLRRWKEAFPQAELESIPDAGHFPHEEQGEELSDRVRSFLKEY